MGADQLSACLSCQKNKPDRLPPAIDLASKAQGNTKMIKKYEGYVDVDIRSTMTSHKSRSIFEGIKTHEFSTSNTNNHTANCQADNFKSFVAQHKDSASFKTGSSFNTKRIALSDFKIVEKLGSGSFASVFKGYLKWEDDLQSGRKQYAIKQMKKNQIHHRNLIQNIKLERKILKEANSNFITKLGYAFKDEKYYYLMMECAQKGDLYDLISSNGRVKIQLRKSGQETIRFILACIILGLEYLHQKNIVYRDLKPENVLIFEDGYLKLTDFGLCKDLNIQSKKEMKAGTPQYFAPEIVLSNEIGKAVDLWSLGIIAYQLVNYQIPFEYQLICDGERFAQVVRQESESRIWKNIYIQQEMKYFINSLLRYEPKQRLGTKGWEQIKNHAFFKKVNFDWESLKNKKMNSPLLQIMKLRKTEDNVVYDDIVFTRSPKQMNIKHTDSIEDWSVNNDSNIQ